MTAWSSTNKNANITLLNGGLTASVSDNLTTHYAARCDTPITSGLKRYREQTVSSAGWVANNGNTNGLGIVNSSFTFGNNSFLGSDTNSIGYYNVTGSVFFNNAVLTTIGSYSTGAVIGEAVDFTAGHVWWTLDGLTFNNAAIGSQNPVGNVGGIALPSGASLFAATDVLSIDQLSQNTVNFGATTFTYAALFATLQAAGYTAFDSPPVGVPFAQQVM
jgi:hypothetical protein